MTQMETPLAAVAAQKTHGWDGCTKASKRACSSSATKHAAAPARQQARHALQQAQQFLAQQWDSGYSGNSTLFWLQVVSSQDPSMAAGRP
jgi:hypothetical protein